jgi:hypothetical protein
MKNKELGRRIVDPMMTILPEAANHIIIAMKGGNAIDITSDPSSESKFNIITSSGERITITKDGDVILE